MRLFREFVKQGLVKPKRRDDARARNLISGARNRKMVMEKYLPLNKETSVKIIEECYDVIRELPEAKLSREGYKSYNHEVVVSYLLELGFSKEETLFLDSLREIRHGTKYYGKTVSEEYASKVKDFLTKIYSRLLDVVSE